jgi:hypothetical protein
MSDAPFEALRTMLSRHRQGAVVTADDATQYALARPSRDGRPTFLAAVQQKRRYVAVHLFPVYERPELLDTLTPALRRRMHGKSCFQFTKVDRVLYEELERLMACALRDA